MFFNQKSHLCCGLVMGMMAGAAAVAAVVLSCPQGKCMAKRMMRRGKRMVIRRIKPMLDK